MEINIKILDVDKGIAQKIMKVNQRKILHKKIAMNTDRRNRIPYINVSFLEFDFPESHIFLENPHSHILLDKLLFLQIKILISIWHQ